MTKSTGAPISERAVRALIYSIERGRTDAAAVVIAARAAPFERDAMRDHVAEIRQLVRFARRQDPARRLLSEFDREAIVEIVTTPDPIRRAA